MSRASVALNCLVILLVTLNMALFWNKYQHHEAYPLLGTALCLAKACAGGIYVLVPLLLLSMTRGWLASLADWLPSKLACSLYTISLKHLHVRLGVATVTLSIIHALAHLCGTVPKMQIALADELELALHIDKASSRTLAHMSASELLFKTVFGITGVLMLACLLAMAVTSIPMVRRSSFNVFKATHQLFYLFVVILSLHGTAHLLQQSQAYLWLVGPVCLIVVENIWCVLQNTVQWQAKATSTTHPISMTTLQISTVSSGGHPKLSSTLLSCALPHSTRPGQHVLVCIPAISRWETHPFLVLDPACQLGGGEGNMSYTLQAMAIGDWTSALHQCDTQELAVRCSGPYGMSVACFLSECPSISVVACHASGAAPFVALAFDALLDTSLSKKMTLYMSESKRASSLWLQEMIAQADNPAASCSVVRDDELHATEPDASEEAGLFVASDSTHHDLQWLRLLELEDSCRHTIVVAGTSAAHLRFSQLHSFSHSHVYFV